MRKPNTPIKPNARLRVILNGVHIYTNKKGCSVMFGVISQHLAVWNAINVLEKEGIDGYGAYISGHQVDVVVLN